MRHDHKRRRRRVLLCLAPFVALVAIVICYYFLPVTKIPAGVVVDHIVVHKSQHRLQAFSEGRLVATYTIAIGKHAAGAKEFEGDLKTPEGIYTINSRNPYSGYHKNLGISYPNEQDRLRARQLGKPTGGDIKIHGLKNGRGYIGKLHRWRDWTNGCIALDNAEVDELYEHVKMDAVIEIKK